MSGWNGFGRALVFGAVAAAALLLAGPLLAGIFGAVGALRVFAVGVAVAYLAGLGPDWRRGFVAAGAAAALGALLLLLPFGIAWTAAGAAAIVAVCRSGLLYRARPLRAWSVEAVLLVAGLALAAFLAAGSWASLALATWGYFLVQSAFFLAGGVRARREPAPGDPFERAAKELAALLR
ncbi:MAG: hypothetical protein ACQGVC_25675 [Myxococcota bacterium]